jgi:hypothetical protein
MSFRINVFGLCPTLETLWFLQYQEMDEVQNAVIPCVLHHHHNPLELFRMVCV